MLLGTLVAILLRNLLTGDGAGEKAIARSQGQGKIRVRERVGVGEDF